MEFAEIRPVAAHDCSEFVLLNESIAEIRTQLQVVSARKSRKFKLLFIRELPRVRSYENRCVGPVTLPRIDGAAANGNINGYQTRNVRKPVIGDREKCRPMMASSERTVGVDLELLSVFQPFQVTITVGCLECEPTMRCGI